MGVEPVIKRPYIGSALAGLRTIKTSRDLNLNCGLCGRLSQIGLMSASGLFCELASFVLWVYL